MRGNLSYNVSLLAIATYLASLRRNNNYLLFDPLLENNSRVLDLIKRTIMSSLIDILMEKHYIASALGRTHECLRDPSFSSKCPYGKVWINYYPQKIK